MAGSDEVGIADEVGVAEETAEAGDSGMLAPAEFSADALIDGETSAEKPGVADSAEAAMRLGDEQAARAMAQLASTAVTIIVRLCICHFS